MNTETPQTVFDAFTLFSGAEEHQDNTSLINIATAKAVKA